MFRIGKKSTMLRIRRKFVLVISISLLITFILLYILLDRSIEPEEKNQKYFEDKLKQLEKGLDRHKEEVGEIKKQINSMYQQDVSNNNNNLEMQINHPKFQLNNKDMIKDFVIKADVPFIGNNQQECLLHANEVPQPNIQMLNVYRNLSFDNVDGGVWKQGWPIQYDSRQWNAHHKLKVFVVPHSHNDPGWIKTFDEYYDQSTKLILTNMLNHLLENRGMTFIWAEISYFAKWYDNLSNEQKKSVKSLLKRGQLEFVTGGWVMPDEANSHWVSILQQLTEGQTWLKQHFNITPISSWSIDPFGHSATMPFLLKHSGFQNLLIQRTHYAVKKRLAQQTQLEFKWRQIWDSSGNSGLFTHMMPFYSYDVPHTCGPDPKVCCQFDFKRLPGYGLSCPWRIAPSPIDDTNVAQKSELIVDQWRKKSTLYKTRSLLIPLGDDFRYSSLSEWEQQNINYERLFDYINNEERLNVIAKFGTLQEYFDSVREEKDLSNFPSLSGDFFTYADRDDHYWSGYFTSRPFHKRLDRILMRYLRSAEMLYAWKIWDPECNFNELLSESRKALSLFQHHDGITGTARDYVMRDYARLMLTALKNAKFVIQQAAYRFLTKPSVYQPDYKFMYFNIDDSRSALPNETRPTIIVGDEIPIKYIVLHNSLPRDREELVEFFVSKPFVLVTDLEKTQIASQIIPVWSWHKSLKNSMLPHGSTTKYKIIFKAKVPSLGMSTYIIQSTTSIEDSLGTTFSRITILTDSPITINLGDYPHQVVFSERQDVSINLPDSNIGGSFNENGLLKSLVIDTNNNGVSVPVHLEFLKYGARQGGERSGAYLFLPDGPASKIELGDRKILPDGKAASLELGDPIVLITKGTLESSVATGLPFAIHETIIRSDSEGLEIVNLIDIGEMHNTEIIMRLSTGIKSKDIFYTDLNGLQIIKRQRFNKLPIQANYYPVPSTIYIQDERMRLTLLSGQPLGGSSLESGQIEIMQDRRLNQDDNRGLGQPVVDNTPVLNIFKLTLENIESCTKQSSEYPGGFLTVLSHRELDHLLYPFEKLVWHGTDWSGVLNDYGSGRESLEDGFELAVLRDLPYITTSNSVTKEKQSTMGIVIYRNNLEDCNIDVHREGMINLRELFDLEESRDIYNAHITLLKKESLINNADDINMCPMDIKGFIVNR